MVKVMYARNRYGGRCRFTNKDIDSAKENVEKGGRPISLGASP
jgi:hypothetical protein